MMQIFKDNRAEVDIFSVLMFPNSFMFKKQQGYK